jgi:hypothetical protein
MYKLTSVLLKIKSQWIALFKIAGPSSYEGLYIRHLVDNRELQRVTVWINSEPLSLYISAIHLIHVKTFAVNHCSIIRANFFRVPIVISPLHDWLHLSSYDIKATSGWPDIPRSRHCQLMDNWSTPAPFASKSTGKSTHLQQIWGKKNYTYQQINTPISTYINHNNSSTQNDAAQGQLRIHTVAPAGWEWFLKLLQRL